MSLEIRGINNLIKKLDNLTNIRTEEIVSDVAKDMSNSIKSEAKKFSNVSYMYVGECEARKYGRSCFIDVGLKNDLAPWEEWKELWYHQWGYRDYGLNFHGNPYVQIHKMWFDIAVKAAESTVRKKLKSKIKDEINNKIRG